MTKSYWMNLATNNRCIDNGAVCKCTFIRSGHFTRSFDTNVWCTDCLNQGLIAVG